VKKKKKTIRLKNKLGQRGAVLKKRSRQLVIQTKRRQKRPSFFISHGRLFDRLAIVGTGLIGSSIARAVRHENLTNSIVATARTSATRQRILELNLADKVVDTNAAAVEGADLVIVCVPVGAYGSVAKEIGPHLIPGAIVSDVGSVKRSVVRDMAPYIPKYAHFIPAHPVAGTENSGPDAGFAELFQERWCILTPTENANKAATKKLATFWEKLGANVQFMTPDHHDLVLAVTSHIPHLIAYTILCTAAEISETLKTNLLRGVDKPFRQFTRIAASDPTMWRDIFLANNDAVRAMLFTFTEDLSKLTRAMRDNNKEFLLSHFRHVQALRNRVAHLNQAAFTFDEDRSAIDSHGAFRRELAVTVHLPRLIAYAIVGTADELRQVTQSEVLRFSAGGFRDFTSIAASDPNFWGDSILENKDAVLDILGRFNEDLFKLTDAMRFGKSEFLYDFFQRMREIRRETVEKGNEDQTATPSHEDDLYLRGPYSAD
jgi:cyclohexadieny/prephenate dehydrogenase